MDANRAADELKVIRSLMERPIKYSTQSGLAGIVAGAAALAGVAADAEVTRRNPGLEGLWISMCVWAAVFAVAFLGTLLLTRLRERRRGMPAWSLIKRRILLTILPPFVAGVGLTIAIIYRYVGVGSDEWLLIPAVWMLFYGVALWQLGEFSIVEVRVMGAAFILAGIVAAALYQASPYEALGVTFGGFHIVYGLVVWVRHGG